MTPCKLKRICCWFCGATKKKEKRKYPPPTILHLVSALTSGGCEGYLGLFPHSFLELQNMILYGPCTKCTYIKRPLTSPNHTPTITHFMFLS